VKGQLNGKTVIEVNSKHFTNLGSVLHINVIHTIYERSVGNIRYSVDKIVTEFVNDGKEVYIRHSVNLSNGSLKMSQLNKLSKLINR